MLKLKTHIAKSTKNKILTALFLLNILLILTPMLALATDVSDLYDRVDPSVVVLHTYSSSPVNDKQKRGLGSGIVISKDGKILTAAHVVHNADAVHVEFKNGRKILARVIGSEPQADLALLQLQQIPKNLPAAKLGDSNQAKVGQEVFVIGSPLGLHHSLTMGHISARHSGQELGKLFLRGEFFQTDAAINRGNSGGPLFNLKGEVIGIVSHIETTSGGNQGLGFAVTSNTARHLMLDQKSYWTGLNGISMTPLLAKAINYPLNYGILVQTVAAGSVSDQLGFLEGTIPAQINKQKLLLGGDIIVAVADIPIKGAKSLFAIRQKIDQMPSGDTIKFRIYRKGVLAVLNSRKP